ncbi:MAG: dTDP-4-dehydrorhamnose reductase [Bacteroidales bacterium]|nr:dTDP-4-dehydrorhamnose reductase [Bacteroidales bacterium]
MNVLVTGANGQLGREMRRASRGSESKFVFSDIVCVPGEDTVCLDITNPDEIRSAIERYNIDCIVNCAAYTNVDKAEDEEDTAALLNATAPGYLAAAMARVGGLLIHISTDYVFGGTPVCTPCRETQEGAPLGVYGRTKLQGEKAVIDSGCRYAIIRTAWLYSPYGKNFVKTMLSLLDTKPALKVVSDQIGSPTCAKDLAGAIMTVLASFAGGAEYTGIYHYSNEGICSWYEFACEIAALSNHDPSVISPCTSSEYPSKVTRPAYSVLDKTLIKDTFGIAVPHWKESLRECLAAMGIL